MDSRGARKAAHDDRGGGHNSVMYNTHCNVQDGAARIFIHPWRRAAAGAGGSECGREEGREKGEWDSSGQKRESKYQKEREQGKRTDGEGETP